MSVPKNTTPETTQESVDSLTNASFYTFPSNDIPIVFFRLKDSEYSVEYRKVSLFKTAKLVIKYKLYRHILDSYCDVLSGRMLVKSQEATNFLISKLLKVSMRDTEKLLSVNDISLNNIDMAFGATLEDIHALIELLQHKIDNCELHRSEPCFNAETMIDMKLALLDLKTLSLVQITP